MIETDSITVMLAGSPAVEGLDAFFARQKGWRIITAPCLESSGEPALKTKPQVLAVVYDSLKAREILAGAAALAEGTGRGGVVMVILAAEDPGPEFRDKAFSLGIHDLLLLPVTPGELRIRIERQLDRLERDQKLAARTGKLNRAMDYLDRFREELALVRKEYKREKEMSYNSLKQITAMTREREALREQVETLENRNRHSFESMESFLIRMIESRNETNKGHAARVADIAVFVAEKLELEQARKDMIRKAAMLHEAGLLFLPASVLRKRPDELTDYEQSLFDQQASRGASLLAECPGFEPVCEILRHVNENADGTGYPKGLRRKYIPLAARIVAGADLLDTYWSESLEATAEETLAMLESQAGGRLDPRVVNCLEKYVALHRSNGAHRIRELGVNQLEPGMTMGAGLFTLTGTKLFSAGTRLTEHSLERLIRYSREYPIEETVFIKVT